MDQFNPIQILHELDTRLRIRCPVFLRRNFEPAYVEAMLEHIEGVESVRINVKAGCAVICYNGDLNVRQTILERVSDIPDESFERSVRREAQINPVFMGLHSLLILCLRFLPKSAQAVFTLAVGAPVLLKGILVLFSRGIKSDVLDAAVVGFSLARRDYFTANAIVFLLNLGEYLEHLSEDKTTNLLRNLLRPTSKDVWVYRDGQEISMPVSQLKIGDVVVCGPGEMIPVDGVVHSGEALINQSSITGESMPVYLSDNDRILSGSVVEEGKLYIRAQYVGGDTGIARINRFLENSLRMASPVQKKSEDLADSLVPVTFGLGLGIYAMTRDVSRAAAVLTVDYSCAIKLATPVTARMAMYSAAHLGVLLKGARALDALANVDTVVFDKTGTLTKGELTVDGVYPVNGMEKNSLLALTAAVEEHYKHPVARAVVEKARIENLSFPPVSEVDFIVAHGVSAYIDGERVLAGSRHFLEDDEGIDCSEVDGLEAELHAKGKSTLLVARDKRLAGVLSLTDALRPEAGYVLERLKQNGVRQIVVLTGDHRVAAHSQLSGLDSIDSLYCELKPEDKAAIVKDLQDKGQRLAFIGDGVNDAPALLSADVGICMMSGAAVAREAALVILLKDDLRPLSYAREIATHADKAIQNSFKAIAGLNSLYLILASCGLLSPVAAASLHNLTTIGVLGYSGWAGSWKPDAGGSICQK